MSRRTLYLPLLAALALLAGGCGGDGGGTATSSSASIIPADALLFITVNLDSDSDQWKQAEALVNKFPDGPQLLRRAIAELEQDENRSWERDIRPALGDEVGIAILDVQGGEPVLVGIVKPDDQDKLRQLLEDENSEGTVTREIEGWTVLSDKQASLDALAQAADGDTLGDSEVFQQTMEDLGGETLAAVYVNGRRAIEVFRTLAEAEGQSQTFQQIFGQGLGRLESAGTALVAREDGVEWKALARSSPGDGGETGIGFQETFDTTLDERAPAGALAFLSFTGANYQQQLRGLTPQQRSMLQQFEQMLGVSIADVADLISSEGAFYARPGSPFPEATLLLRTDNEAKARTSLDRVANRLAGLAGAQVQQTQIAGVDAGQVALGVVTVAYAVFDGMAVVTTAPTGIQALREDGEKLSDDQNYTDALEGAGVPEESSGFFYLNIEDTVPLLRNYAQLADESVPPQLWTNLGPVRSLVFYGASEEGEARFSAFLRIE